MESGRRSTGGFSFENCARNAKLVEKGFVAPKAAKTGTTIVGVVCKDAVVLGADTRATSDTTVFEKKCEKIHYIAPNIYCCGAGTAADTEHTTALISSKLVLHRLDTVSRRKGLKLLQKISRVVVAMFFFFTFQNRESRVSTALTMLKSMLFRYQGYISAALVLGGFDIHGPHLYTVYPHGSTDCLPYVTMGSGSLAAMAVFESKFKDGLSIDEGKQIVYEAISAGIYNDMGSGGNVNLCVIKKGGAELIPGYAKENERPYRSEAPYAFPKTVVVSSTFKKPTTDAPVVLDTESMEIS